MIPVTPTPTNPSDQLTPDGLISLGWFKLKERFPEIYLKHFTNSMLSVNPEVVYAKIRDIVFDEGVNHNFQQLVRKESMSILVMVDDPFVMTLYDLRDAGFVLRRLDKALTVRTYEDLLTFEGDTYKLGEIKTYCTLKIADTIGGPKTIMSRSPMNIKPGDWLVLVDTGF